MTSNPPLIRGDIVCSRHKLSPIVIRWHSSVLFVCVTDEVCQSPLDGLTPFASVLVLIIRDCIHLNVLFGASRTICSNIANCWSGPPGIPDLWCWSIEVHQYYPILCILSIVYGCLPAAIVNIYFRVMSQHYHGAFYHTPSISFCALFANSQFSSITNYLFCEHFVM